MTTLNRRLFLDFLFPTSFDSCISVPFASFLWPIWTIMDWVKKTNSHFIIFLKMFRFVSSYKYFRSFPYFCAAISPCESRVPFSQNSESPCISTFFKQNCASTGRTKKGDPPGKNYGPPLSVISTLSFAGKNFKPLGACLGYIGASLLLAGHFIPAPFFNEFRPLPGFHFP